jgi:predicted nucleotidyltransferase
VNKHLQYLSPHEVAAVTEFVSRLQVLGQEPLLLWLFGSKARGDSAPDSDIDLLVVLTSVQPETQWLIWRLGSDVSLEYDVLLNVHIIDADRWDDERLYQGTLWCEIQRDGVPLQPQVPSALVAST